MRKKANIEIQFHWIFVLVVGALILLFFFSLAYRHQDVSQDKLFTQVRSDLRTILTGAISKSGVANEVTLPQVQLFAECDGIAPGSEKERLAPIDIGIVFAPKKMEDYTMVTWSHDWSIPYRTTNFLYLTVPAVKYVFIESNDVGAADMIRKLYDEMPEKMTKDIVHCDDFSTYDPGGAYHIKFIDIAHPSSGSYCRDSRYPNPEKIKEGTVLPKDLAVLDPARISAVVISTTDFGSGQLHFLKKKDTKWDADAAPMVFYGVGAMYGALYAHGELYKCSMARAFREAKIVTEVYKGRSLLLRAELETEDWAGDCRTIIGEADAGADQIFKDIMVDLDALIDAFEEDEDLATKKTLMDNLEISINKLVLMNEDLELASCPTLY